MSKQVKKTEKVAQKEVPTKVKVITWSIFGVILLGVLGVLLWMEFRPEPKEPVLPDRFENVEHITSSILEVILTQKNSEDLTEEELEIWEEIDLSDDVRDIYVFIYNQDYEASPDSENLESLVNEVYNKENRSFAILVLNYLENENVVDLLNNNNVALPTVPVLVHIEGESIATNGVITTALSIQAKLTILKGA